MRACRCDGAPAARDGRDSLLVAALEAIGRAAMVVDASGRIVEANSAARASLANADAESSMRDTLRAVVRGEGVEHPDWSTTPVARNGQGVAHLVVARPPKVGVIGSVGQAARKWGLTRRQHEVLAKVADGHPNKIIAARLGVSVRTVEVHLTALFMKARVASRAELLAKLLTIA